MCVCVCVCVHDQHTQCRLCGLNTVLKLAIFFLFTMEVYTAAESPVEYCHFSHS